MGRAACTEPQCLYKGALYLYSLPGIFSHGRKRLPREEVDLQPAALSNQNCSLCQWTI